MSKSKAPAAGQGGVTRSVIVLRVLGLLAMAGLAALLVMFGIDLWHRLGNIGVDQGPSEQQQIASLQLELSRVTVERDQLAAAAPANPAQGQMATQIKALEVENSKLNTALALAERVLAGEKAGPGLAIRALQAEMVTPGQLHYVVLLSHGATKNQPHFAGQMQLAMMMVKGGVQQVFEFPAQLPAEKSSDAARYDVKVLRYQRLDGTLTVPDGATVQLLRVRFVDKGKVVAEQSSSVKESADVRP